MDSGQEKAAALGDRSHNPRQLTVMVMRSVGKIRSFKVSRRLIFWASMFFLAYMVFSLYIINSYFDLGYRYRTQAERLGQVEKERARTGRQLLQTKQHVAILEDYIKGEQDTREAGVAVVKNEKDENKKEEKEEKEEIIEKIAEEVYGDKEGEDKQQVVAIEDPVIRADAPGISLDFKLVNKGHGENAMEGFIHIIAMDRDNNIPDEWSYHNDRMRNGLPVNFQRGQPFLIQRFKPYHRKFNPNSASQLPAAIRIIVYDRSGTLLLQKVFEVKDVT